MRCIIISLGHACSVWTWARWKHPFGKHLSQVPNQLYFYFCTLLHCHNALQYVLNTTHFDATFGKYILQDIVTKCFIFDVPHSKILIVPKLTLQIVTRQPKSGVFVLCILVCGSNVTVAANTELIVQHICTVWQIFIVQWQPSGGAFVHCGGGQEQVGPKQGEVRAKKIIYDDYHYNDYNDYNGAPVRTGEKRS